MVVHRYWHGSASKLNNWTGKALRFLGHKVETWNDETLPKECLFFADKHMHLVESRTLRHRANLVRWWLLAEYGGWWADYDLIPLRSFTTLPFPATASHDGVRCTSWLAFPAQHSVPLAMLEVIKSSSGVGASPDMSGERLLQQICSPEIPMVPLPINRNGYPEGEPWAVHLFSSQDTDT